MSHRNIGAARIIIVGCIVAGSMLAVADAAYAQSPVTPPGSGTSADPYLISQLGHLVWMGNNVGSSSGMYYSMTADIDASATAGWNDAGTSTDVLEGFKPIGSSFSQAFTGVFEGNRHIVSNLTINRPSTNYVGLFGLIYRGAQVRNLGVTGGMIRGNRNVGGLIGWIHDSSVLNCFSTATVTGTSTVGGLVGGLVGSMTNCYAAGAVSGTGSYVGGLIGVNDSASVSSSYWDMQTSGQNTSFGGTGKSTTEMKQQATFAGWDFINTWGIVENATYPYLRSLTDSDGDGVIDQIDACPGTVPGANVDAVGCPPAISGDFNHDGDVDSADLDTFQGCAAGPAVPYPGGCDAADFDQDNDVDQSDFGILQRCYSGQGIPADPGCAE